MCKATVRERNRVERLAFPHLSSDIYRHVHCLNIAFVHDLYSRLLSCVFMNPQFYPGRKQEPQRTTESRRQKSGSQESPHKAPVSEAKQPEKPHYAAMTRKEHLVALHTVAFRSSLRFWPLTFHTRPLQASQKVGTCPLSKPWLHSTQTNKNLATSTTLPPPLPQSQNTHVRDRVRPRFNLVHSKQRTSLPASERERTHTVKLYQASPPVSPHFHFCLPSRSTLVPPQKKRKETRHPKRRGL